MTTPTPFQGKDEVARLRQAFATTDRETGECPAPELIWDGAQGKLAPDALRNLLDHVALCATCAEDWRLAVELGEKSAAEATPLAPVVPGRFQWRTAVAALAAGLVLAVVGLWVGPWSQPDQAPVYREAAQSGLQSKLPAGAALPRESFLLRWSPAPGASSYEVLVSTEDLRVLATAEDLRSPEYRVPAEALAGLPAGTRVLWQVKAAFPDGSGRSSATFETSIR